MYKLKQIVVLVLTLLSFLPVTAQHMEDSNIYSAPDSLDITHCREVWLTPGFWAQAGADVHVYIDTTLICFSPDSGEVAQGFNPGQVGDQNYVYTVLMREPELQEENLADKERIETINYYDGLGRSSQSITIQGSPSNKDIVQPIVYDEYGREKFKYLPYVPGTNTGQFNSTATNDCKSFYLDEVPGRESDSNPFAEVEFDGSPLNLVTGEKGVGAIFHEHPTDIKYLTNTDPVKNWSVSGSPASYTSNDFVSGELYLTEFTDEDGHKTREYKDKLGRVVCKAANDGANWLNTYYVYDNFGLLRCVVPPKANGPTDTELCYYYTYDHRKRMIEKSIPGAKPVNLVYDARDRLVMVLDGNNSTPNKPENEWQGTEYDNLNRPVKTGIVTTSHNVNAVRGAFENAVLFSETAYTVSTVLTETYYDNYSHINGNSNYQFSSYNTGGLPVEQTALTKGLVTVTITHVVKNNDDVIPKTNLLSVMYYDTYGRLSRQIADNHMGGIDVTDNTYNFAGEITQTLYRHNAGSSGSHLALLTTFEYDHQGRLIAEKVKVNEEDPVIVAAYDYNELGEQIGKYLHGNEATRVYNQKVDYNYNIKGWLTGINQGTLEYDNDLYAINLQYNNVNDGNYNGNIWKLSWIYPEDGPKGYTFEYDNANRLLSADYTEGVNSGDYSTSYNYDANGNLSHLNRYMSGQQVDQLVYQYANNDASNQLLAVDDQQNNVLGYAEAGTEYAYDDNGNMISDPAKGSDIIYNYLNLPQKVTFANTDNIRYIYSAGGAKLRKAIADEYGNVSKHFDYSGPLLYENNQLKAIFTSAGRIVPVDDNGDVLYKFEYNLQDHLGNTRVVFGGNKNGKADLLQTTEYYPFGMVINQQNYFDANVLANKYLYNGKELQDDDVAGNTLDWYDYGARFYDPQLGRWHSVDPLAEKYFWTTPYSYVESNPIIFIDPNGEDKVLAIVYNRSNSGNKALWGVEVAYDLDKGTGAYKGKIQGQNSYSIFEGKFDANNKSNFLNANLFTSEGALGIYHQYQNGKQDFGLSDVTGTDISFDQRWNEDGTKIPTSVATSIGDIFNLLNDVSIGDTPLGEKGADAIIDKFKDFDGSVEYIKGKDGNHSFRFTVNGTDVSFMIDYILTKDEKDKENED